MYTITAKHRDSDFDQHAFCAAGPYRTLEDAESAKDQLFDLGYRALRINEVAEEN